MRGVVGRSVILDILRRFVNTIPNVPRVYTVNIDMQTELIK